MSGLVIACGGDSAAPDSQAAGDGAADGGAGSPSRPDDPIRRACGEATQPDEAPCAIHESFGVFVSASLGADVADGSRKAPYRRLADAIEKAASEGKRVYACAERYDEQVELPKGTSLYGYFQCAGLEWKVAASRARITAPSSPAVRITDSPSKVILRGVSIVAPAGVAPGDSSIGVVSVRAPVDASDVDVTAGNAKDGEDGAFGTQLALAGTPGGMQGSGNQQCGSCINCIPSIYCSASSSPGGQATCVGAPGHDPGPGGAGGAGGRWTYAVLPNAPARWLQDAGNARQNGLPVVGMPQTAAGAILGTRVAAPGLPGASGKDGASADRDGKLDERVGYLPVYGTRGSDGAPGQGGGGGAGYEPVLQNPSPPIETRALGIPGGGGGAGGCPGLAGTAGGGGGASIAWVAIESPVELVRAALTTGQGGRGGRGNFGSTPTLGGAGGVIPGAPAVTHGQPGGAGGVAGLSGHGSGGVTAGVAYSGPTPTLKEVEVKLGAPGAGRSLESAGAGRVIAESPGGRSGDVVDMR